DGVVRPLPCYRVSLRYVPRTKRLRGHGGRGRGRAPRPRVRGRRRARLLPSRPAGVRPPPLRRAAGSLRARREPRAAGWRAVPARARHLRPAGRLDAGRARLRGGLLRHARARRAYGRRAAPARARRLLQPEAAPTGEPSVKVVIPLAGKGTRLRPHTYLTPKPLLEVGGKPVMSYILDELETLGVQEIVFVTGYLGEKV